MVVEGVSMVLAEATIVALEETTHQAEETLVGALRAVSDVALQNPRSHSAAATIVQALPIPGLSDSTLYSSTLRRPRKLFPEANYYLLG